MKKRTFPLGGAPRAEPPLCPAPRNPLSPRGDPTPRCGDPIPLPPPGTHEVRVPAPAKINTFLHVVGRRADGYHLLQSHFRLLDWCDWLTLTVRDDGVIERRLVEPAPAALAALPAECDLTVRAARLLRERFGAPQLGVTIAIEKALPLGGGLGGGSSNAATVLLALNRLWGLGLPRHTLIELGLALGADLPFFLFGEEAFVEGVGERLTPYPTPVETLWLLDPGVEVATAAIFASPLLTRDTPCCTIATLAHTTRKNDLEPVARRLYSEVDQAIQWLRQFGTARMTGSGGCVVLYSNRATLPSPPFGRLVRCRTLARHPLWAWAE